jgi:hypothetical protein
MTILTSGLVFWDIIYLTELPDAFRDPTQAVPLGMSFFPFLENARNKNRKGQILRHFREKNFLGFQEGL